MNPGNNNKAEFIKGLRLLSGLNQGIITHDGLNEVMEEHGINMTCDAIDLDGPDVLKFAEAISKFDGLLIVGNQNGVRLVCTKQDVHSKSDQE